MSLARILGKSTGRPSYQADSRWILPSCFIGLEHEYEGVLNRNLPLHSFADFWNYHEEGSLKDNGAEYAFSHPLFGSDAYNALDWLVSHAKASKWKCSKRTGIHVHLDVRDLTVPQFAGMSMVYAAVEPILYTWVGDGRASSHFCIPLYSADEALLDTCKILSAAHIDNQEEGSQDALRVAERFQRYAGYNLQALHKFGSVEFRHLQTTHDVARIVDWVNMVMSLKAAAYKLPQSDGATVRMLERMSSRELLNFIFTEDLAKKLYTETTEEEFRTKGLPTARDLAVHGCSGLHWVQSNFPKGENTGFIKWLKTAPVDKNHKKREYIESDDDVDFEPEEFDADEPPQVQEAIPVQAPLPPPLVAGGFAMQGEVHQDEWAGWVNGMNHVNIPRDAMFEPAPAAQGVVAPQGGAVALNRELRRIEVDAARRRVEDRLRRVEQNLRNPPRNRR